ncbi:MAG TPA: cell division protein FtsL [Burkholderiales bacterium]|nr:cell division protein FtsL [Burkholderiales bacterium]
MTRLNFLLALTLIVCALGVVTSQHKARKLFAKLQQEQELSAQLDVEWGQLLLEQSTWATHSRIEKIAIETLQMRVPDGKRSQVVTPNTEPAERGHE